MIIFHIMLISFTSLDFQIVLCSIAKRCESSFSFTFPHFSPVIMFSFHLSLFSSPSLMSLPLLSSLGCLSSAALIKHRVGGGTAPSSRADEKGSNSSSQDGTLTHNGPAILSAPHRFPTESPLLRQLFNRPPPQPEHTPTHI